MKLRNKKTGEIVTKIDVSQDNESIWVFGSIPCMYTTLAKLNETWEDYEPKEPLIKGEKIRKAVRAWAEANAIEDEIYCEDAVTLSYSHGARLELCYRAFEDLRILTPYTIAELCGEEK